MSCYRDIPWLSGPVVIQSSKIPSDSNVDIRESSFFRKWGCLPTTEDVRCAALRMYSEANPNTPVHCEFYNYPPPVTFEDKNLFVKWGGTVHVLEAQCLLAIHRHFGAAVPVPEVYGWREEGNIVYIFMELIHGCTLESAWDSLGADTRKKLCLQLRSILHNLRLGKQDDQTPAIGSIKGGPLCDRAIGEHYHSESGPFQSVKEFHDWFAFLCRRPMEDPHSIPIEPFRKDLDDDSEIKLTHGDLNRRNLMITAGQSPRIIAIVDWEQSGWFPAYWEVRKALYTAWHGSEWATTYLPMILDQYNSTAEPWDYYVASLGN